jgi:hypothetical protein
MLERVPILEGMCEYFGIDGIIFIIVINTSTNILKIFSIILSLQPKPINIQMIYTNIQIIQYYFK